MVRAVVALALLLSAPVHAGPSAWTDRDALRIRFERLAEPELKSVFLHCSDESSRRLLGFEEAARCSIALEVLKARSFAGDFGALLAWWRQHRRAPPDTFGSAGGERRP